MWPSSSPVHTPNREVAHGPFVNEKTVEAHPTRVYRKLGLRRERSAWRAPAPTRQTEGLTPLKRRDSPDATAAPSS